MLIAFEGIDGAGKTTVIDLVHREFAKQGIRHVMAREPGGTPKGEVIRQLLKGETGLGKLQWMSQIYLLVAAHIELGADVILPAEEEARIVLCDRTTSISMQAYQIGGRRISRNTVMRLLEPTIRPDLVVWLDLPPDVAAERRKGEGDEYDKAGLDFQRRVHEYYQMLFIKSKETYLPWIRVDARHSPQQIAEDIIPQIRDFADGYFGPNWGRS